MAQTTNNQTQSINSLIVDIIISCLKGSSIQQPSGMVKTQFSYLLSQALRQYRVPSSNWHLSQGASALWSTITTARIEPYSYKEVFTADKLCQSLSINTYKGASRKEPSSLVILPNNNYAFNQIFIVEHIVPCSDLISALRVLYEQYKNNSQLKQIIIEFLDEKLHLVRLLRTEDRAISRSSNRISTSDLLIKPAMDCLNHIYNKYYLPAGIKI